MARSVGARDGLATERRYTTRVLPVGVLRGVRDALLRRPGGAGRAGAIVAGVAAAAGGYVWGTVRARGKRAPFETPVGGDHAESGAVGAVPARERAAA
ncbi:hypothetical protein [Streptomyces sp. NRRL S-1813]|uniref:hypothetical protein n=1 Tax=Streptomyces sp. NRRL S-1813 TaxID=1463888 RepID=UPI0004C5D27B